MVPLTYWTVPEVLCERFPELRDLVEEITLSYFARGKEPPPHVLIEDVLLSEYGRVLREGEDAKPILAFVEELVSSEDEELGSVGWHAFLDLLSESERDTTRALAGEYTLKLLTEGSP